MERIHFGTVPVRKGTDNNTLESHNCLFRFIGQTLLHQGKDFHAITGEPVGPEPGDAQKFFLRQRGLVGNGKERPVGQNEKGRYPLLFRLARRQRMSLSLSTGWMLWYASADMGFLGQAIKASGSLVSRKKTSLCTRRVLSSCRVMFNKVCIGITILVLFLCKGKNNYPFHEK